MVDAARLRDLVARLEERLARLEPYAASSREDFLADEEGVAAAKYYLLTAIEDALAIGNHVVASEGYRGPTDYADTFRVLAERGVLANDLAGRLEAMARFRNLLVHVYARVEDSRVHEFLSHDLADAGAFIGSVLEAFPEVS